MPYEGKTPWELASQLYDRPDRTFVPTEVSLTTTKAYIIGWSLSAPDHEYPDTIFCDLVAGKVTFAVLGSEIKDEK